MHVYLLTKKGFKFCCYENEENPSKLIALLIGDDGLYTQEQLEKEIVFITIQGKMIETDNVLPAFDNLYNWFKSNPQPWISDVYINRVQIDDELTLGALIDKGVIPVSYQTYRR